MPNSLSARTAMDDNANSLANGSFKLMLTLDFGTAPPGELFVQFALQASAATSGNKQAVFYAVPSLDGTNYADAPTSTTDRNALQIGVMDLPDTNARLSRAFPVSAVFAGGLPRGVKIYAKNECGVALAATGQLGYYQTETFG